MAGDDAQDFERIAARADAALGRLQPNDLFADYRIASYVDEGGFGEVYRAERPGVAGPCALKRLRPGLRFDPETRRRFVAEIAAQWALRDLPGVVHAFGHSPLDPDPEIELFVVMEWAAGGDLAAHADFRSGDPARLARLFGGIAEALAPVHRAGVVHRDLKPGNVLFRGDGTPAVGDFGLALDLGACPDEARLTETGEVAGTLDYIAPEQLLASTPTSAADIYALGSMIYEALAGAPPGRRRSGESEVGRLDRVRWDAPDPPPAAGRLARDLRRTCLRCLEKDPARRYADAAGLAAELARVGAGESLDARTPGYGGVYRRYRWARANKLATAAVGLSLLFGLAAALAAWSFWDRNREAEARSLADRDRLAEKTLRLHEARVAAARTAARRGDWPAAMPLFQEAIDEAAGDGDALRVERLMGYLATNDLPGLDAELAGHLLDAEGRPLPRLGDLRYRVHLAKGCALLCTLGHHDEGLEEVRFALGGGKDLGGVADFAFAKALGETSPRLVISHLEQAVLQDPFHIPAQASLAVALLCVGRVADSAVCCDALDALAPKSPVPPLVRAVIRMVEDGPGRDAPQGAAITGIGSAAEQVGNAGRLREASRQMRIAADRLHAEPAAMLALVNRLDDLQAQLNRVRPTVTGIADASPYLSGHIGELAKLAAATKFSLAVPTVDVSLGWVLDAFNALLLVQTVDQGGDATDRLRQMVAENSDGVFLAALAASRIKGLPYAVDQRPPEEVVARLSEMADAGHRACLAPSLVMRSDLRYQSRLLGVLGDLNAALFDPDPCPKRFDRVRAALPHLVVSARNNRVNRDEGLQILCRLLVVEMTQSQKRLWPDTDDGREAFRLRRREALLCTRALAEHWRDDNPNSNPPNNWLEAVEVALLENEWSLAETGPMPHSKLRP